MKTIGVIPARFASTRLPGKPLRDICGKPMIQHVYERSSQSRRLDEVLVATDDHRIVSAVENFGGIAKMTSPLHSSGSDRVAEVIRDIDCDIVVNIQGDEPLIRPEVIDEIAAVLIEDDSIVMATGCYKIPEEDYGNPDIVKVVRDRNGNALYFSRSLIPYPRNPEKMAAFEHIGVYAYSKDFLLKYVDLDSTPLCDIESLEQLKVLEHGYDIRVVETKFSAAISVDTQEDLDRVIAIITEV